MGIAFVILVIVAVGSIAAGAFFYFRSPVHKSAATKEKSKGEVGESYVSGLLSALPASEYKIINNLLLEVNGKMSQIDHVVVSLYGIFVVETKAYKGLVYGGKSQEKWTQNIYGKKFSFRNPFMQNYGHVMSIRKALSRFGDVKCISVIAFSDEAIITTNCDEVVNWSKLKEHILSFKTPCLSASLVEDVYKALTALNKDSEENRGKHLNSVGETKKKREERTDAGLCPRCGGNLVERKGRYGSFMGCSNYPKCRYKTKVSK